MSEKLVSSGLVEHNTFQAEVLHANGRSVIPSVHVTQDNADAFGRAMSSLVARIGGEVRLVTLARIKAVYKDGKRTRVNDYHSFYDGLSDEEYEATRILCCDTHTYV